MWWPSKWREEERAHQLALVAAQNAPFVAALSEMGKMVHEMAEAQKAQAGVLQTWLDSFKVTELPRSTTVREDDEVRFEQERAGLVLHGMSEVEQMALVANFEDLIRLETE